MDTKLTVEKKAELFDKIMEQRQQMIHHLYDLIDAYHSFEINHFGLGREDYKKLVENDENTHFKIFKRNYDEILEAMKGYKRAELLDLTCEKWPIEKIDRPYWMGPAKDIRKTKRWLVQKLVMFFNDFSINKSNYPGADVAVYEDYMSSLIYTALSSIGIEHSDDSIIRFLNEVMPNDGDIIDEDGLENWQCKSNVMLNDIVNTFNEFLNKEPSKENVKEFSDKFSEIYRTCVSLGIVNPNSLTVDKSFELPKLLPLPLEYGMRMDVVPEESNKEKVVVVVRVNKVLTEDDQSADKEKELLDWGEKSGLKFVEAATDGKTKRRTWLFKCELKKST